MELSRRGAFSDFLTSSNAPMQNDESRVSLEDLGVGERVASREQLEDLERIHLLCGKHFPPENIFHRFCWKIFSTIFAGKYFPPFFGL